MTVPPSGSSNLTRLYASLLALLLGYVFVLGPVRQVWRDHWLVKDGQEGIAVVTKEHWAGHNVVIYQYRVGQKVYGGDDRRSRQNPRYNHVQPGEKTVVYFSASHPWLSAINLPRSVGIQGLPVILLGWLLEAGLLVTVINPRSRWAFNFTRPLGEQEAFISSRPSSELGAAKFIKDKLRLVGWALLLVVAMAAFEVAIDSVLGRK